jgi:hypothetical protein
MTYLKFAEIISHAIDIHVSRDTSLVQNDLDWEVENCARTAAKDFRLQGLDIPPEDE